MMWLNSYQKEVYSYQFNGKLYDVGSKLGFLKATIEFALKERSYLVSLENISIVCIKSIKVSNIKNM